MFVRGSEFHKMHSSAELSTKHTQPDYLQGSKSLHGAEVKSVS